MKKIPTFKAGLVLTSLFFGCCAPSFAVAQDESQNCASAWFFKTFQTCDDTSKPIVKPNPDVNCTIVNGKVEDSRCIVEYKKIEVEAWVAQPDYTDATKEVGRGLNQDWGCNEVKRMALAANGKTDADLNISIRLQEIANSRSETPRKDNLRRQYYTYNCGFHVQVKQIKVQKTEDVLRASAPLIGAGYEQKSDRSCGVSEGPYKRLGAEEDQSFSKTRTRTQTSKEKTQVSPAVVQESLLCLTCDNAETVVAKAKCLAKVRKTLKPQWDDIDPMDNLLFIQDVVDLWSLSKNPLNDFPLSFVNLVNQLQTLNKD